MSSRTVLSRCFSTSRCQPRSFNLKKKSRPPKQRYDANPNWAISTSGVSKNQRDVPFMFLPHTVKKAYIAHESQMHLTKVFAKHVWLSKTLPTLGIPEGYFADNEPASADAIAACSNAMTQHIATKREPMDPETNTRFLPIEDRALYNGLVPNLLRVAMLSGAQHEHLYFENCYLYSRPRLETHWPRNYQFFAAQFKPDYVLRTRGGHERVEITAAITPEELASIPGPFDVYDMNVHKRGLPPHLRNRSAMEHSHDCSLSHAHTTIMIRNCGSKDEEVHACAVSSSFMMALAQAQDRGNLFGTELHDNPITTQCVVTNGREIAFCVYQLNTLHLLDDKGVWNRAWLSPVMRLPYVLRLPTTRDEELVEGDEGAVESASRMLINFIHKKPTG